MLMIFASSNATFNILQSAYRFFPKYEMMGRSLVKSVAMGVSCIKMKQKYSQG